MKVGIQGYIYIYIYFGGEAKLIYCKCLWKIAKIFLRKLRVHPVPERQDMELWRMIYGGNDTW